MAGSGPVILEAVGVGPEESLRIQLQREQERRKAAERENEELRVRAEWGLTAEEERELEKSNGVTSLDQVREIVQAFGRVAVVEQDPKKNTQEWLKEQVTKGHLQGEGVALLRVPGQAAIVTVDHGEPLVEVKALGAADGAKERSGRRLMQHVLDRYDSRACVVQSATEKSHAFYRDLGFELSGPQKIWKVLKECGYAIPNDERQKELSKGWDATNNGPLYVRLQRRKREAERKAEAAQKEPVVVGAGGTVPMQVNEAEASAAGPERDPELQQDAASYRLLGDKLTIEKIRFNCEARSEDDEDTLGVVTSYTPRPGRVQLIGMRTVCDTYYNNTLTHDFGALPGPLNQEWVSPFEMLSKDLPTGGLGAEWSDWLEPEEVIEDTCDEGADPEEAQQRVDDAANARSADENLSVGFDVRTFAVMCLTRCPENGHRAEQFFSGLDAGDLEVQKPPQMWCHDAHAVVLRFHVHQARGSRSDSVTHSCAYVDMLLLLGSGAGFAIDDTGRLCPPTMPYVNHGTAVSRPLPDEWQRMLDANRGHPLLQHALKMASDLLKTTKPMLNGTAASGSSKRALEDGQSAESQKRARTTVGPTEQERPKFIDQLLTGLKSRLKLIQLCTMLSMKQGAPDYNAENPESLSTEPDEKYLMDLWRENKGVLTQELPAKRGRNLPLSAIVKEDGTLVDADDDDPVMYANNLYFMIMSDGMDVAKNKAESMKKKKPPAQTEVTQTQQKKARPSPPKDPPTAPPRH
eukprot:COSAG02_NODE_665_length_18739_cov_9.192918_1_plen_748_part_00